MTRPTRMPEKSAAVSFPPMANTARPHWKPVMNTWKTTASPSRMTGASQSAGMPKGRHPAGSRLERSKYRPSVMMKAAPRAMPITPRVAMKGGRRTSMIRAALRRPASTPVASPAATLTANGCPDCTNRLPVTTPEIAITAPGERSTPPEMMTMAAPMAAIP